MSGGLCRATLVLGLAWVMAACGAGWGQSYGVLVATQKRFVMHYDAARMGPNQALRIATNHCRQFGRSAVPVVEVRAAPQTLEVVCQ